MPTERCAQQCPAKAVHLSFTDVNLIGASARPMMLRRDQFGALNDYARSATIAAH
jgi:hypothetical protein